MMHDRLIPTFAGFGFSGFVAAAVDLNAGAVAGFITLVGTASLALVWQAKKNNLESYKARMAAELQAKIDYDSYARDSLSAKVDGLQRSMDDARQLATERAKVNTDLRQIIDQLQADLKQTKADLDGSRQRRHDDTAKLNGRLLQYQAEIQGLKGLLGQSDKTHVEAINANSDNIKAVAEKTETSLPAPAPHLDPLLPSDSDDDYPSIPR